MASSSLLSRIVLSAAFLAATGTGVVNYLHKGKVEEANQKAAASEQQAKVSDESAKKATAEAKASKEEAKIAAEAKAAADANATKAAAEAEKAKKDAETALAQVQEKDTQIADLTKKVADVANPANNNAAPAQDPEMAKELADLKAKTAEQVTLLKSFQAKAEEAEKESTALKADAARRAAGLAKPGLEGKILAVNSNWNFVVLNIGDHQGVVSGASLIVKRGGSLVAKLRVTSVEPSTSIADVQVGSTAKGTMIQPGDVVIFPGT